MNSSQNDMDYLRIESAIRYIREHRSSQPSLEEVASHVHLSPHHFQRLFTMWAGISPKKFLQYLTLQYARERLAENLVLEEIAHDAGLSGTGRLHDLFIQMEGMTPDQYRRSGKGLTLRYGFHHSPFGKYILALSPEKRICSLEFITGEEEALARLQEQWTYSDLIHDPGFTSALAAELFREKSSATVRLLVRGTPFQLKVWEALLKIPAGQVVSYQVIATYVKNPRGLQAVGSAIGKNPVAFLIPCHRVIKKTGHISEYRWGSDRKSALIGWEASLLNR